MKLLKYSNFRNESILNENLDGAKKLLRDTYKMNKAVTSVDSKLETDPSGLFLFNNEGDVFNFNQLPEDIQTASKQKFREIKVAPEENAKVERSDVLKKVRDVLGDKLGYAYMFTYLFLVERTPIDDLKNILSKLIEYKDLLSGKDASNKPFLRRPISNYIDTTVPNNSENLIDDLENISLYRANRKIYNELTPILKKDYDIQPPIIKKQVDDLALSFTKLGMVDGKIDKHTRERLWKLFFGEMKTLSEDTEIRGVKYKRGDKVYSGQMVRFKNIREFIKAAQNYLKNIDNTETVKFYEAIEKCNSKYGSYGAQVMYDEGNILILEIKSFQANQMLNSHTRHCIKDNLSQWDYYVGGDNCFNKQYYIYNFNLPSYDTKSVIGITIEPKKKIRACHLKDDASYSSGFQSLLKEWEKEYSVDDLWSYFEPMSDKEVEEKRKRIIANREIVKKGLSLESVKKYLIEDGADVNAQKGQALDNAVAEGNIEKVKYLLDFGASPNLRSKQESTVNRVADLSKDADEEGSKNAFEILKYLLRAGAELTPQVFKGLLGDYDAVKFCLDNGLNPNFEDNLASRLAIKRGLFDILKLLIERGADLKVLSYNIAWAYESNSQEIVDYLVENNLSEGWITIERSMSWIGHSPKLNNEQRISILKEMQKLIDDGKVKPSESGYRINDGKVSKRNASYQEVIDMYGSLYNWVVKSNGLKES